MSYTPPSSGDVDFSVKSYTPPSSGNVILDVTQNVVILPDAINLNFNLNAEVISAGFILRPGAIDTNLNLNAEVISAGFILRPDAIDTNLNLNAEVISAGFILRPDAIDINLNLNATPLISSGVLVTPDNGDLPFDIPLAGIQPFLYSNEWQIDLNRISPSTDIETGPQSLSLSFEVDGDAIDKWRAYDRAGDLTTESGFGGSFRALDRSDQGTVEVRSSFDDMRPFEPNLDYFVAGYSESQIAPDRYEVSLDLQRPRNRGQAFPAINESGGEWLIETDRSTLALSGRQVGTIDSEGSTTGPQRQLAFVVSDKQASALIDDLGYPDGISTRAVPDGEDTLVDDNGSQSITLTAPNSADIDDGEWLVPGWSLSFNAFDGARRWRVEVTLAQ